MTKSADGVWRVERALRAKVGDRATELLHRKTKHLADLSPHEVAQAPNGDRIVLAELDNIVLQASGASLGVRHRPRREPLGSDVRARYGDQGEEEG